MAAYRALAPVFDAATGTTHTPGSVFRLDDARGAALVAGGFAEPAPEAAAPASAETAEDGEAEGPAVEEGDTGLVALYEGMTNAALADILRGRGVTPPSKATKETLISLLAEGDG